MFSFHFFNSFDADAGKTGRWVGWLVGWLIGYISCFRSCRKSCQLADGFRLSLNMLCSADARYSFLCLLIWRFAVG